MLRHARLLLPLAAAKPAQLLSSVVVTHLAAAMQVQSSHPFALPHNTGPPAAALAPPCCSPTAAQRSFRPAMPAHLAPELSRQAVIEEVFENQRLQVSDVMWRPPLRSCAELQCGARHWRPGRCCAGTRVAESLAHPCPLPPLLPLPFLLPPACAPATAALPRLGPHLAGTLPAHRPGQPLVAAGARGIPPAGRRRVPSHSAAPARGGRCGAGRSGQGRAAGGLAAWRPLALLNKAAGAAAACDACGRTASTAQPHYSTPFACARIAFILQPNQPWAAGVAVVRGVVAPGPEWADHRRLR